MVIRAPLLVLLVLVMACSESGTLAEAGLDSTSRQADFAELRSALVSIGCHDTKPGESESLLTIAAPDGAPAHFACPSSEQGTARRHVEGYLTKAIGGPGRRHPGLAAAQYHEGGLVQVTIFYQCAVEDVWFYIPAMGEYVYAYRTVDNCWVTEVRLGEGGGVPAGTWGTASGAPTSAPSAPTPIQLDVDTVCTAVTGDNAVFRTVHHSVPGVLPGALNDKSVQDSLRAMLRDSYGTIDQPLPHSARRENAAWIFYLPLERRFLFQRIEAESSICHVSWPPLPPLIRGAVLSGRAHSHTIRDGEPYYCPLTGRSDVGGNEVSGGGSAEDWAIADNGDFLPMYTIDPDRMWRLNPGVDESNRGSNPERWSNPAAGQCATRAAF